MTPIADEINAALAKLELLDVSDGTLHRVRADVEGHLRKALEKADELTAALNEVEASLEPDLVEYFKLGSVAPDANLTAKIHTAEDLGHQVHVMSRGPFSIDIIAEKKAAEPIVCASCQRMIAQSWRSDCPECEGSLRPEPAGAP